MNFNILGELARNILDSKDEFSPDVSAGAFGGAVAAALAEREKQQAEQLGAVVLDIMKRVSTSRQQHKQAIRDARRQVTQSKNVLNALDRAWAYAEETQNFVPLADLLGFNRCALDLDYTQWQQLSSIPKDWAPKEG